MNEQSPHPPAVEHVPASEVEVVDPNAEMARLRELLTEHPELISLARSAVESAAAPVASTDLELYDPNWAHALETIHELNPDSFDGRQAANYARQVEVTKSATVDELTGLMKRDVFTQKLERYIRDAEHSIGPEEEHRTSPEEAEEDDKGLVVLLLDLDGFKQVNDTYGHAGGDEVLAQVGEIIEDEIRARDFAGRWGGDEFVITLNDRISDKTALNVAERIIKRVEAISFEGKTGGVSASVGAVEYEPGMTADGMVKRADESMYDRKRNGKGGVSVAARGDTVEAH